MSYRYVTPAHPGKPRFQIGETIRFIFNDKEEVIGKIVKITPPNFKMSWEWWYSIENKINGDHYQQPEEELQRLYWYNLDLRFR